MARETHQKVWVFSSGRWLGRPIQPLGVAPWAMAQRSRGEFALEPVEVFVVVGAGGVGEFEDVEAEAVALWMEVELADHAGFVAGGAEFAGEGGGRIPGGAHEADHAVLVGAGGRT